MNELYQPTGFLTNSVNEPLTYAHYMLIGESFFNCLEIKLCHYQACVCVSEYVHVSLCPQTLPESKSGHLLSYPPKDGRALDGSRKS